jgi:pimeloyl-ACP methyl ester carboxylesterase
MMIFEEKGAFKPQKDVNLETIRYYSNREAPSLVFVKGIGGSAGNREGLVEQLAKDYNVMTFSPRGSGNSDGDYTIDSLVQDTTSLLREEADKIGHQPYVLGHSMGGYTLARVLGKEQAAKKAVLLAPLLDLKEQLPSIVDLVLRNLAKKERMPGFINTAYQKFSSGEFRLCDQGIKIEKMPEFLEGLYDAETCTEPLKAPTKVILAGGSCLYLPISNEELAILESKWRNLGAETKVFPNLDHNFKGKWFNPFGEVFKEFKREENYREICDFLNE